MTEEQLNIAINTKTALMSARQRFKELESVIRQGFNGVKISHHDHFLETFISEDESVFLTELLEYRRKEVIALEKEFASL